MSTEGFGRLKTLQSLRGLTAFTVPAHPCLRLIADSDDAWFACERILNAHVAVWFSLC